MIYVHAAVGHDDWWEIGYAMPWFDAAVYLVDSSVFGYKPRVVRTVVVDCGYSYILLSYYYYCCPYLTIVRVDSQDEYVVWQKANCSVHIVEGGAEPKARLKFQACTGLGQIVPKVVVVHCPRSPTSPACWRRLGDTWWEIHTYSTSPPWSSY